MQNLCISQRRINTVTQAAPGQVSNGKAWALCVPPNVQCGSECPNIRHVHRFRRESWYRKESGEGPGEALCITVLPL